MNPTVTALERAFQLAQSGDYASVPDIRKQLSAEGYSASQVAGRTLTKQLLALTGEAQANRGWWVSLNFSGLDSWSHHTPQRVILHA